MIFPRHDLSLHLTHNQHKAYYETVEQYFTNPWMKDAYWVSEEDKIKAIESDELWELQWYPDTPIGSYYVVGSNLEEVIEKAINIQNEEDKPTT